MNLTLSDSVYGNENRARFASKLQHYVNAVERVGYSSITGTIGWKSAYRLDSALDAYKRQQADGIIANYIAEAQEAHTTQLGAWEECELWSHLAQLAK